jgi:ubiquinone/menaquinone biosynthesis C-methylase UbiE
METSWDYTRLASSYDARPDYAISVIDEMLEVTGIELSLPVADIGAGTGKLTRLLLNRGLTVHAVEPNDAMRALGIANTDGEAVKWSNGTGEDNGLPSEHYGLTTFGSSFNVVDRRRALVEAARCLVDYGWFGCMWNHRDLEDPLQKRVEKIIHEWVPAYQYGARRQDQADIIDASGLFESVINIEGQVQHTISVKDYMSAWRSHATLERQAGGEFDSVNDAIEALLEGRDQITVPYTTRVYCAQLRSRVAVVSGVDLNRRCLLCGRVKIAAVCDSCGLELYEDDDGLLRSTSVTGSIDYPGDGNELTMQVEDKSFWFKHRNEVIASLFRNHLPSTELAIWDIGGGNGFQAAHLQEEFSMVMVEPGLIGCKNARRRGVKTIIQSTLEGLLLPDASVSALSFFDVLEHLKTPQQVLAESQRVLRPGGKLFITVPAFEFLWSDEDVYAKHYCRYTAESLKHELENAGFGVDFSSYYFQALLLPIYLIRALPYRFSNKKYAPETVTMDQDEHQPHPALRKFVEFFLDRELSVLKGGGRLSWGSSLLAVASRLP